jgi:hypothetical protein
VLGAAATILGSAMILSDWHVGAGSLIVGLAFSAPDVYFGGVVPWLAALAAEDADAAAISWAGLLQRVALFGSLLVIGSGAGAQPHSTQDKQKPE